MRPAAIAVRITKAKARDHEIAWTFHALAFAGAALPERARLPTAKRIVRIIGTWCALCYIASEGAGRDPANATNSGFAGTRMKADLSADEARRLALAASGFGGPGPGRGTAGGKRALSAQVARLGCVQIDSVNVLVRSHYLPFFSRLGAYDVAALDELLYGKRRTFCEYWAHEASIVELERWPLLRWRMERAARGEGTWSSVARIHIERPDLVSRVRARIAADGPLAASDFEDAKSQGSWWGWSDTKRALEYLFWSGEVTTRRRRASFEREYDVVERVIPAAILGRTIDVEAAQRELVAIAARALGVASEADLRDYFRLDFTDARRAVGALVASGALTPVAVEGWRVPGYVAQPLRIPRGIRGRALLSPFDNLIWNRPRAARLFDFDFRLEIYTPVAKRVHGYYVLPYLVDGRLVARVDLKFDRQRGTLLAHAVHTEHHAQSRAIAAGLRDELAALAAWLGAETTSIPPIRRWR